MNIKKLLCLSILIVTSSAIYAQHVLNWKFTLEKKGKKEAVLVATAVIQSGWHLYDVDNPEDGPFPLTLTVEQVEGAHAIGKFRSRGKKPTTVFDPIFELDVRFFKNTATFVQRFKVTDRDNFVLKGGV